MKGSIGSHHLRVALALCAALMSPIAATAQPANDASPNARAADLGSFSGTLLGATNDGSASVGAPGQRDVWYTYIADQTGTLHIDTCGSFGSGGADTVLSLHFAGPGKIANELAANDDLTASNDPAVCIGVPGATSNDSAIALNVTLGQKVWIRVSQHDGLSGGNGTFYLRLRMSVQAADAWFDANPVHLGVVSGALLGATNDGSSTVGAPGERDVWYTFTAFATGTLRVDTCGSKITSGGLDTVLSLHSAGPGTTANELVANDNWPGGSDPTACSGDPAPNLDSAVALNVTLGQTIWIRIAPAGANDVNHAFQLRLRFDSADQATSAISLPLGSFSGNLAAATNDGSASVGSPGQPDVWFTYTATRSGTLHVDTCGTHDNGGLDPVLSLHSAGPGTSGNQLIANDNWQTGSDTLACQGRDPTYNRDSAVSYAISVGTTIWIRIARYDAGSGGNGDFRLRLGLENDSWQHAIPLDLDSHQTGILAGATTDGSASLGVPGELDLWYAYAAPADQWVVVDTCGSELTYQTDTVLSVHRWGPGVIASQIAASDDWPDDGNPAFCAAPFGGFWDSALLFHLGAGEGVLIRVSRYSNAHGSPDYGFALNLPEPRLAVSLLPELALLAALSGRRRSRRMRAAARST